MRKLSVILAILLTLFWVQVAQAHPADMYFYTHTIKLTSQGIDITWTIFPGPLLAYVTWAEADLNQDEVISAEEARAYVAPRILGLTGKLDGTTILEWQIESVEWPESLTKLEIGDEIILVELTATWPEGTSGQHSLSLHNQYEERISINWFYINGLEGVTFYPPEQQNGLLEMDFLLPGESLKIEPPAQDTTEAQLLEYWDSGLPTLPSEPEPIDAAEITPQTLPQPQSDTRSILTGFVRSAELSFPLMLGALAISMGLGALHAFTPGHGKAIVAAYLVGSRGRITHAISLGAIVTLTHTGSVLMLGLLTMVASQYIVPTALFPLLEITSGLLIVIFGAHMLYRRLCFWMEARKSERERKKAPRPTAIVDKITGRTKIQIGEPIGKEAPPHPHIGPKYVPKSTEVRWKVLLALGISGGLVPCPDAIAILLVAVAINRTLLGLSFIVAFSLGMSLVLIVIGIAMVKGQQMFGKTGVLNRLTPVLPVASALAVLVLGLGLTYSAVLRNDISTLYSDLFRRPSLIALSATNQGQDEKLTNPPGAEPFEIENASVLFIALDQKNHYQLTNIPLPNDRPKILSQEPSGIWDFALSPDTKTIVYMTPLLDSGSELWKMSPDGSDRSLLLSCPNSVCSGAVWSPDGERLMYERTDTPTEENSTGMTSIWWLDPENGETGPVFRDSALPGFNPRWSPDLSWLSYTSPGSSKIQIYSLKGERSFSIPNRMGGALIWSPDGSSFLVTDVEQQGERFYTHLLHYDLESEQYRDITGEAEVEDNWASWSPDGEWLAIVRREWVGSRPVLGDQVWLMRPDGSQAHPITSNPEASHGTPIWSPDSKYLLFQLYPLKETPVIPEILMYDIEAGEQELVIRPGSRPIWLP